MPSSFLDYLPQSGSEALPQDNSGSAPAAQGVQPGGRWEFAFSTGIECSNPTIVDQEGRRIRRDLLEECGHYDRWQEDLHLVKDMGIPCLRYGFPIHLTWTGAGQYDWSFTDLAMAEIQRLGITPIVDLMHFGVPDWIGDMQNPELPTHFADYCGAVAERYPWVRFYTPINEIYVAARNSGQDGLWNERLKTDHGFVTALKHLVAANLLANRAIVKVRPDAVIVQSESAEYLHHVVASPSHDVKLRNKLVFLSLDLLYSKAPDSDVMLYCLDNGMSRDEFMWFMKTGPAGFQIMGNDYYGGNEALLLPDGSIVRGEDVLGWYLITLRYYKRYYKPVMHTETNVADANIAPRWLWKQWVNVLRMRRDGIPVLGFTWYSLGDQVDWDSQLSVKRGNVNPCGLFDMDRKPRPVAHAFRQLIKEFKDITALAHGEMFELTERDARSRYDI